MKRGTAGHQSRRSQAQRAFDPCMWRTRQLSRPIPFYGSELFQLGCPPLASFIAAFLGCLMTLHMSASGVSPSIASSTATLLLSASLILTRTATLVPGTFFSSAYGGSFIGMTPVALLNASVIRAGLPLDAAFVLLSLFGGLVFSLGCALDMWVQGGLARGYGGRLGALAAVASFLFVGLAPLAGPGGELFPISRRGVLEFGLLDAAITLALCSAGMLATMGALRWAPVAGSGRAVRIFAAATLAFAGLVILHLLGRDAADLEAFYAGCFLGMSTQRRLRSLAQAAAAAVLLTGLLILTFPILPAVGGSLGSVAFVSVVFVDASVRLFVEAGESPRQTMVAFGRGLLAAAAILAVLLSSEMLWQRPLLPAGPIVRADSAVEPQVRPVTPPVDISGETSLPSRPFAPPAMPPDLPPQILRPEAGAPLAAEDSREPASTITEEPSRRIRPGPVVATPAAPVRRPQIRAVPPAIARTRIMARHEVQPAPEWQPDPSTLAGP